MIITKLALPRRTFLRGLGAAVALPFLDAMVPALSAESKGAPRFAAVYIGNGANMSQWTPSTDGVNFELSQTLNGIKGFRDRLSVFTGLDNFPGTDQGDVGGQHPRSAPGFMSAVHAKPTEGADLLAGTTIDQIIAAKICTDTKLPSLELTVDRIDVVGACDHGYACAYMNCMSWRTPTTPLPSETNPRFVFERMFGVGSTVQERLARAKEDRSLLDELTEEIADLRRSVGARDRAKLSEYFDAVRDVEQRIVKAESTNSDFAVPDQPVGVPGTFKEYVELLFDLQALAFQADITRVSSLMMARENTGRAYPEIGVAEAHHATSHHDNNPEKLAAYAKINSYHVQMLNYFLKKLDSIPDGDGTLLDRTVVLMGSGMSDGNVHSNYNVPAVVVGGKSLGIRGNRHVRYPKATPLANLMLGITDRYGVHLDKFGDSNAAIDLTTI
ncbi:MAG: DUF1552 domain-containing protein [Acidobacteriota bacterium]